MKRLPVRPLFLLPSSCIVALSVLLALWIERPGPPGNFWLFAAGALFGIGAWYFAATLLVVLDK